ncbi:MAG TPA: class IV adenylate cyclase [Candidatus Moranbacteria bacterium]|nr:class IV adenylate cyclase [Candidatus Moranbacteria bacterium]HRY28005.1 class IV adenylate cyclase [Candidatus Moranbacteria bacterium]HSA07920.1 class IV adenylate cyclase [Candidatus Moranbacteria bacterium]
MKNIEVKVKIGNFKKIVSILKSNGAKRGGIFHQVDTYYNCKNGRLKLREINENKSEIIFYIRPNHEENKVSEYNVLKIDKKKLKETKLFLSQAFGEKVIVEKEREIWILKNTRIHLDKVKKAGSFLELETVVKGKLEKFQTEYAEVYKMLELEKYTKIKNSYSDILLGK